MMNNFINEMIYIDDEKINITFDITSDDYYRYKDVIMNNIKNIVRMTNLKSITFSAFDNRYTDWNVKYYSTHKRKDEINNKYFLIDFYSINYRDLSNSSDCYLGGFRVTREITENEYYNMEFTLTPLENLYLNMISGLIPEDLSESEVNLLKENLGDNWFEELGYYEPEYKRSRYDTFNNHEK